MGRKIWVRRETDREVYLHGIIEDVSIRLNSRVDEATQTGPTKGWYQDAVAGVIILAFLNETFVNAIGAAKVAGWNRMWPAEKRFKKLNELFLPNDHVGNEPFKTVAEIREIRNEFGHAMPFKPARKIEEVIEDTSVPDVVDLSHPIEKSITIASYRRFVQESKVYRDLLLEKSGVTYWDIKTKESVFSTYLGEAE
jgi:hypothetical protein